MSTLIEPSLAREIESTQAWLNRIGAWLGVKPAAKPDYYAMSEPWTPSDKLSPAQLEERHKRIIKDAQRVGRENIARVRPMLAWVERRINKKSYVELCKQLGVGMNTARQMVWRGSEILLQHGTPETRNTVLETKDKLERA